MRKRISIDNVSDKTVIGKFHDNQLCVVIFENDKDTIPHLHIIDSKTQGENIHVKLLLRKANYSIDTPNVLKDTYINSLTQFFEEINESTKPINMTYWQTAIWLWNSNNKNKAWYTRIPNYKQLKKEK